MRGVYESPAGVKVEVDFDALDGELRNVCLGAMAIIPASSAQTAREGIRKELEKCRLPVGENALAARIRAGMPVDAVFVGITTRDVAAAIRNGLGERFRGDEERIGSFTISEIETLTRDWRNATWRLLPEARLDAATNLALDEVLLEEAIAGRQPPTLRFWGWSENAVVLGRSQSVERSIDVAAAREAGFAVVRRISGGGTMLAQPDGAITYSIYLPETMLPHLTIRQSYEVCDAWLVLGLRAQGIDAHYVSTNDIACADGKIGGAAQCRRGGHVLHHTTLAYSMDQELMMRVLRLGQDENGAKRGVASASKRVSPLNRQTKFGRHALAEAIRSGIEGRFKIRNDRIGIAEMKLAETLIREKYGLEEWTFDIP